MKGDKDPLTQQLVLVLLNTLDVGCFNKRVTTGVVRPFTALLASNRLS